MKRIEETILHIIGLLLVAWVLTILSGCRTIHEVETRDVVKTDTLYKSLLVRDSIYVRDSLVLREKGDTIFSEKWHTKYIERLRTDTLYEVKSDSVFVYQNVEKKISKMERWKYFFTDFWISVAIGLVVWLLILLLKWYAKVRGLK